VRQIATCRAGAGRKDNNMYVLQYRVHSWDKWDPLSKRYPTVEEAKAELAKQPFKSMFRIAEEYTVVRYKAVK
jgi:hypothetical protein